jgi:hypothetical protein
VIWNWIGGSAVFVNQVWRRRGKEGGVTEGLSRDGGVTNLSDQGFRWA